MLASDIVIIGAAIAGAGAAFRRADPLARFKGA